MRTVGLTGKSDKNIIESVSKALNTTRRRERDQRNWSTRTPESSETVQRTSRPIDVQTIYQKTGNAYQQTPKTPLEKFVSKGNQFGCKNVPLLNRKRYLRMKWKGQEQTGNVCGARGLQTGKNAITQWIVRGQLSWMKNSIIDTS